MKEVISIIISLRPAITSYLKFYYLQIVSCKKKIKLNEIDGDIISFVELRFSIKYFVDCGVSI